MDAARNSSASDKSHRNLGGYIGDRDSSHCLDESSTEIANGDGSSSDCTSETDPNRDRNSPTDDTSNLKDTNHASETDPNRDRNSQTGGTSNLKATNYASKTDPNRDDSISAHTPKTDPSPDRNSQTALIPQSNSIQGRRSLSIQAVPELIQRLPHNLDDAVREALYNLPPREVHELINLICVLRQIDCIDKPSSDTPVLLNGVTSYLVERLKVLKTNHYPPDFLQTKSAGLFDIAYWLANGFQSYSQLADLSTDRKRHFLVLAYFLQGKFLTDREKAYVKNLLLSYCEEISDFRGFPRFTM